MPQRRDAGSVPPAPQARLDLGPGPRRWPAQRDDDGPAVRDQGGRYGAIHMNDIRSWWHLVTPRRPRRQPRQASDMNRDIQS